MSRELVQISFNLNKEADKELYEALMSEPRGTRNKIIKKGLRQLLFDDGAQHGDLKLPDHDAGATGLKTTAAGASGRRTVRKQSDKPAPQEAAATKPELLTAPSHQHAQQAQAGTNRSDGAAPDEIDPESQRLLDGLFSMVH